MTSGDIAVVVGAIAGASVPLSAAFLVLWKEIRGVHRIVNQESTDRQAYNLLLANTLREHGIEVPVDAAVKPPTV
jgi:hypothetical protein